jgi:uncharacterized protein (UPF0218 family)
MIARNLSKVFLAYFLILTSPLFSTTINIPGDYNTIQNGINAAQHGDTVLVDDGIYYENINFKGKNIVVTSGFIIDREYSHILNTIIDGSQYTIIDSASCVIFVSGEDSTAVIQGFTLTGGKGTTYDLRNINPSWQAFTQEGGGVFLDQSSATIKNNLIINNEAARLPGYDFSGGGGISSFVGNPRIYNNVIMLNDAGYACGLVLNWSGGIIRNNIIYGNYGGEIEGAGGIMIWDVGPAPQIVENNTIVENISALNAGGILNYNTPSIIRNNIIWGNQQQSGLQVFGYQTATFEYCNTEETYPGTGNISVNPYFDSSKFYLNTSSLCIDAGSPVISFNDKENLNNPGFALFPSLGGLRNDLGAYGGPGAMLLPDFAYITGIEGDRKLSILKSIKLNQNYPNPFNSSTTIEYGIAKAGVIKMAVYNSLGQRIKELFNEYKVEGEYKYKWTAENISSGVYYIQMSFGDFNKMHKVIFLK